jgi:hypothetical protein
MIRYQTALKEPLFILWGFIRIIGVWGWENFCIIDFLISAKKNHRDTVRACTSPVNTGSVAFHKKIGFSISKRNGDIDGIQVSLDYDGPGDAKVLFEIRI